MVVSHRGALKRHAADVIWGLEAPKLGVAPEAERARRLPKRWQVRGRRVEMCWAVLPVRNSRCTEGLGVTAALVKQKRRNLEVAASQVGTSVSCYRSVGSVRRE